jgi:hypothetical protein
MKLHLLLPAAVWIVAAGFCPRSFAADEVAGKPDGRTNAPKFIRLTRDAGNRPQTMESAIVRYASSEGAGRGVTVELIGAIHIGEKEYYDRLNKEFEQYDVLLYELVAADGQVPKTGPEPSSHPVGILQQGMKNLLELEYQLECIDYRKRNFVHADMSLKELEESMARRSESLGTILLRIMARALAQQDKIEVSSDLEILMALFDRNRALALKRLLAEQFENADGMLEALSGPDGSTLITERNKVALRILSEQIARGKKRIGIFYGAGHLPDMEERLRKDFGLRRQSERWVVAWDLRGRPKRQSGAEVESNPPPPEPKTIDRPAKEPQSGKGN